MSQQAERSLGRADIIWVVDNSGSMTDEAAAVQNNLNTFSQQIAATGIDVHVVLISSGIVPSCILPGVICLVNGICIDPPLGAPGACPSGDDTNIPGGYMHWNVNVDSWNGLAQIQGTFSGWRGMLRPDAKKTFVIVTDDNAQAIPSVPDFSAWVDAQPEFQQSGWRFSGVFCFGPAANCSSAGAAYTQLVAQTGGISVDLGTPNIDWQPVFTQLADAVVQEARPVDCEWAIPPPPEGETLDPELVNVKFTPSGGAAETVYFRNSEAECTEDTGGWYYDDPQNPATVRACPASCAVMQADLGGRVDVQFGCLRETEPIE